MTQEQYTNIAAYYGCTIIDISEQPEHNNSGYICGRTIYLGKFDNPKEKEAAFFHEIGHTLICWEPSSLKVQFEYDVWQLGWKAMEFNKIDITDIHRKYATEQLRTYCGWEWREIQNFMV